MIFYKTILAFVLWAVITQLIYFFMASGKQLIAFLFTSHVIRAILGIMECTGKCKWIELGS